MKLFFSLILLASIVGESLPFFASAQTQSSLPIPDDPKGALETVQSILLALPKAVAKVWKEEALPLWLKMWNWVADIWKEHIWPRIYTLWITVAKHFDPEIEKRKTYLEQEIQKEKEQVEKTKETVETGTNLWDRLKNLLKD